jgi:Family of unknown function (DUF5832)
MLNMALERTYLTLPGQNYALISIVGPEQPQKTEKLGLKIYSMHPTLDDAKTHAAKLQKEDATFDIMVVDACTWALIPPDKRSIAETHYAEEKLEEIFTKYHENRRAAAAMFEKRKRDLMAKPIEGSDTPYIDPSDEYSKYYTKPDVAPIPHPAEILEQLKLEFPDKDIAVLARLADLKVLDIIEERRQSSSSSIKESVSEPSSSDSSSSTSVPPESSES